MGFRRDFFTTVSGQAILLVLSFAVSILLARGLGPDGRGLLQMVLLFPMTITGFGVFGFEAAHLVFSGKYPERRGRMMVQSALVPFAAAVAVYVFGACVVWLRPEWVEPYLSAGRFAFLLALAIVPAKFATVLYSQSLFGAKRILTVNVLNVVQGALYFAGMVVAVTLLPEDHRVIGCVVVSVAAPLIMLTFILREAVKLTPLKQWRLSGNVLFQSFKMGYKAYLANVGSHMVYRLDQFMIVALLAGEEYLGWYVIAVSLAEKILIVPQELAMVLLPHLSATKEPTAKLTARVFRFNILIMLVIVGAVSLLAVPMILLLYGEKFANSLAPFFWLLPGVFALGIIKPLPSYMAHKEKLGYAMATAWIAALVNVLLNLLLITSMGISGAAVASSISYAIIAVLWILFFVHESDTRAAELLPRWQDVTSVVSAAKQWWLRHRHNSEAKKQTADGGLPPQRNGTETQPPSEEGAGR